MAIKSFYLKNSPASGSNFGSLQDGSGTAITAGVTTTAWTVAKISIPRFGPMDYAAAPTWTTGNPTTTQLAATALNNTTGDAWRSESPLLGTFANTSWSFSFGFRTTTATAVGRPRFQLWKGSNATGSNATRVGSVAIGSSLTLNATGTTFTSTVTLAAIGTSVAFNNEYLFIQMEWEETTAGTANATNVQFYVTGTSATAQLVTPDFADTLATTVSFAGATDSSHNPEIFNLFNASLTGASSPSTSVSNFEKANALALGASDLAASVARVAATSTTFQGYAGLSASGSAGVVTDTTLPVITSGTKAFIPENFKLSHILAATEPVTWAIIGGLDAAKFSIAGNRLRWTSNGTMNYKAPTDADFNNVYNVIIEAIDLAGNHSLSQTIDIAVTPQYASDAPKLFFPASVSVLTNTVLSFPLDTDQTGVTWSFNSGLDIAQFQIVGGNTLSFTGSGSRDFSAPTDSNADNVYTVQLKGTNSTGKQSFKSMTVSVVTVADTTPPVWTTTPTIRSIAENSALFVGLGTNKAVTFVITGGADASQFYIDPNNSVLLFSASKTQLVGTTKRDFENPLDFNHDNVYEVEVTAIDGNGNSTPQSFVITVTDADDSSETTTFNTAGVHVVNENYALGVPLISTDLDPLVNWTFTGGTDDAKFEIFKPSYGGSFLRFVGNGVKNFESPNDSNGDNVYNCQIRATRIANGTFAFSNWTITVIDNPLESSDTTFPNFTTFTGGDIYSMDISLPENTKLVYVPRADEPVTFSMIAGIDSARFEFDGNTLRFLNDGTQDFENPVDIGANNTYQTTIRATDASGNFSNQTVTVTITDVVEPVITSGTKPFTPGGIKLNHILAASVPSTFAITGGADAAMFSIAGNRLRWAFDGIINYENRNDADKNNIYSVNVEAIATTGGGHSATQTIDVAVTPFTFATPQILSPTFKSILTNTVLSLPLVSDQGVVWSIIAGNDSAQFQIQDGGTLIFTGTGSRDFNTPVDVGANNTYVTGLLMTNNFGRTANTSITVTILAAPDTTPPVWSTSAAQSNPENSSLAIFFSLNETATIDITGGADAAQFDMFSSSIMQFSHGTKRDFENPLDFNHDNVYEVELTATDGYGNATPRLFSITVTDVDDVSDATTTSISTNASQSVAENYALGIPLFCNELEYRVAWSITGAAADDAKFEIYKSAYGSFLRWVGNDTKNFESPNDADANNIYLTQIRATKLSNGLSSTSNFSITVLDLLETGDTTAPNFTTFTGTGVMDISLPENTKLVYVPKADEPCTFSIVPNSLDWTFFDFDGSTLRFKDDGTQNFENPLDAFADNTYKVTLVARDSAGNVRLQTVTVTITDVAETGGLATSGLFSGSSTFAAAATLYTDTTAPNITSTNFASVGSGSPLAKLLTADEPVTWSIFGGPDAAQFDISGSTLRWLGNGTRDIGTPLDAGADNVYNVTVKATDPSNNSQNQPISITVTAAADTTAPVISTPSTANVNENATLSIALTADESVTWTITGGADAARFQISGTTLRWASNGTKNFEAPDDADLNNVYVVQITATDASSNSTNKTISVTVVNVLEYTGITVPFSGSSALAATGAVSANNFVVVYWAELEINVGSGVSNINALFTGSSTLNSSFKAFSGLSVQFSGVSTLSPVPNIRVPTSTTFSGAGALVGSEVPLQTTHTNIAGSSTFVGSLAFSVEFDAAFTGSSQFLSVSGGAQTLSVSLSGGGALVGAEQALQRLSTQFVGGPSVLTATQGLANKINASFAGATGLTAAEQAVLVTGGAFSGSSILTAAGSGPQRISLQSTGSSTISASIQAVQKIDGLLTGGSQFLAAGQGPQGFNALLNGSALFNAITAPTTSVNWAVIYWNELEVETTTPIKQINAGFSGAGNLQSSILQRFGTRGALDGAAALTAGIARVIPLSVSLSGSTNLAASMPGLVAPILTWITPNDDYSPDFNISGITLFAGDIVTLNVDDDPNFGSLLINQTHTITVLEEGLPEFQFSLPLLTPGVYYARVLVTRGQQVSPLSNTSIVNLTASTFSSTQASFAGSGTLFNPSVSLWTYRPFSASLTGSSAVAAASRLIIGMNATFSGSSAFVIGESLANRVSVGFAGTASFSAFLQTGDSTRSSFSGSSALAPNLTLVARTSTAMSGGSVLGVGERALQTLSSTFSGSTSLFMGNSSTSIQPMSATISGSATFGPRLIPLVAVSGTFSGASDFSGGSQQSKRLSSTFDSTSAFTAFMSSTNAIRATNATLGGSSSFTSAMQAFSRMSVTFQGHSDLLGVPKIQISMSAQFFGQANVTAAVVDLANVGAPPGLIDYLLGGKKTERGLYDPDKEELIDEGVQ